MVATEVKPFSLEDKYRLEEGTILLSGIQALVRLPLDQHRADRRSGLNTATFISGYRGSPLGGLDQVLAQNQKLLDRHQVVFNPAVNEELAATAIMGSQLANALDRPKYDGVLGMWYGKTPGLERSLDAIRHANFAGVGRNGGVLALVGDDPTAKSSTIPGQSEANLFSAMTPIIYPGNVQEILDLGRLGFELSRYAGLWVGFKIVTDLADGIGQAEVGDDRIKLVTPQFEYQGRPWQSSQFANLMPPFSLEAEMNIVQGRLAAATHFAAANQLNQITVPTREAWLGLVAAGKTYYDLRQALSTLGLDEAALQRFGIRILKLGMVYPLEPTIVKEFATGLREIMVIEEKRPFLEMLLRNILYNQADRPLVSGKTDPAGLPLLPDYGELDADKILAGLVRRLEQQPELAEYITRARQPQLAKGRRPLPTLPVARQPYFCSGCPHNSSTVVPEGSIAAGGIGCHTLVLSMNRQTMGVTQMGGEGAQWVGMSPFTHTPHIFQNIGDGTLFHSGSLAIRQAVAARANITYKILYNSAVAMTGGQQAEGGMKVPELVQSLRAEGVGRIIITNEDPATYYPGTSWPESVVIWKRERLDEAQRVLRDEPGVTVLIHDQMCATELRRQRKRGKLPEPAERVIINEAVCEGCGDCGAKSNCLSVQPVETEFGRKTQIHQSSCNQDFSCLKGDCPSFITIVPAKKNQTEGKKKGLNFKQLGIEQLPEPAKKIESDANIYMVGIGGTGVVTVNQILATAARLEGKSTYALDQTGLSQKGGPVAAHLKIRASQTDTSNKVGQGEADCLLAFDILTAANPQYLNRADPGRTVAVVSTSQVPTGAMVRSTGVLFPESTRLRDTINEATRAADNVYLDALQLSQQFFGDHMPANLLVIGAAYQAGRLPLSAASIEQAIELNGVSVKANQAAFRLGRRYVADPEWAASLGSNQTSSRVGSVEVKPTLSQSAQALIKESGAQAGSELERLLTIRVPELIAYQDRSYARQYARFVKTVREAEASRVPGETALSEAVARYLFKLMAYKDEYEVARLHRSPQVRQGIEATFGPGAKAAVNLHPPFMRALGLENKLKFGQWFEPGLVALETARRLRGTPFDPFGYTKVRRLERELIQEYRQMIQSLLPTLSPLNYRQAVELAQLPDVIRGYEEVKLDNVAKYRAQVSQLVGVYTKS